MKSWFVLILLIFSVQLSLGQGIAEKGGKSVSVFKFQTNELVEVDVELEYTPQGSFSFYKAHLETDVCSDGLCKPISISIRWDLLGRFHSYHTEKKHDLTKFDHVPLTKEDHGKLNEILSDGASILRDYKVEDMIDNTVRLKSFKLDAVTGATSKTFDGATVEGALYTVYTLWHFVNGDIRKRMLKHTESLLSDSFVKQMLLSDNRDYLSFVFDHITDLQREKFLSIIVGLISNKDDYIPHFALYQLTDEVLSQHSVIHSLLGRLPNVAPHVLNGLLERIKGVELDSMGLEILLLSLPKLEGMQMKKAFTLIEYNKSVLNKRILKHLEILTESSDNELAQLAKSTLNKVTRI